MRSSTAGNQPISQFIEGVRQGDENAVRVIWDAYFPKLCVLAAAHLKGRRRGESDEEDVALSAFASFCNAAADARFPDLNDRQGLWQLLCAITRRKAIDLVRRQQSSKRDVRRTTNESAFANQNAAYGLDCLPGEDPTPDLLVLLQEEADLLLRSLSSKELCRIAILKLQGYKNKEIADTPNFSESTVERRIKIIKREWKRDL